MSKVIISKAMVERAAAAIIGLLRMDGSEWNPRFIEIAKWPDDFDPHEQREARKIAKVALKAAFTTPE